MMLDDILSQKHRDVEEMKRRFPFHRLKDAVTHKPQTARRSLAKALSRSHGVNLICELKKASPSRGVIREDFQPLRIAAQFEYAGAAAISVLTESHFFKGRPSYLKTVRQVTTIPLLRKDFIFDSYQLYETALLEADAYLLIAGILTEEELKDLIRLGSELSMDALVEVHGEEDLKKALNAGAKMIGINNRNLNDMSVDTDRAKRLLPKIPKNITVVAESGFSRYEELMEYKSIGVHSFLVGTSLMQAEDIIKKIENLLGKDRKWK